MQYEYVITSVLAVFREITVLTDPRNYANPVALTKALWSFNVRIFACASSHPLTGQTDLGSSHHYHRRHDPGILHLPHLRSDKELVGVGLDWYHGGYNSSASTAHDMEASWYTVSAIPPPTPMP